MLGGFTLTPSSQSSNVVYGGTVYISGGGIGPWSQNFNPFSPTAVDPATIGLLYQTLVYWNNANDTLNGLLATSWNFTNSTTLVFNIREGVKWNDGVPFTERDVGLYVQFTEEVPSPRYIRRMVRAQ